MTYFPNNTVANFLVKSAETIDLPGQWEVALVGLHYPHTWPTIKKGVQQTFLYKLGADLKAWFSYITVHRLSIVWDR